MHINSHSLSSLPSPWQPWLCGLYGLVHARCFINEIIQCVNVGLFFPALFNYLNFLTFPSQ